MQRIATTNGLFDGGNPATNTKGTVVTKDWLNALQEELAGVVEGFNLTLDPLDNHQILAILQKFIPPGAVSFFAMSAAPAGWIKANGAALSRSVYARLFTAIGTNFGPGDGATTFNTPDLRGDFLRSWDDGRGIDTGRVFGSVQKGSLAARDPAPADNAPVFVPGGVSPSDVGHDIPVASDYPNVAIHWANLSEPLVAATVALMSGVVRPRNTALLACIKY